MSNEEFFGEMPVDWHRGSRVGSEAEAHGASRIVTPDAEDLAVLHRDGRTCGNCKYFELVHGQELMKATRFVERLVREEKWQVRHLCSPLNELGACGAHDSGAGGNSGSMVTGTMHKGCDQWRPANGKVR